MSDIGDLFALDPNKATKQNMQDLVAYYRSKYTQFKLGDLKAGSSKPRAISAKDAEAVTLVKGLDLKDLL